MEETGRDRGKLCELTLRRPLQSVPIIGSMLCAYFVLLVVLALPFTPTLTDLLPAHLHLRHSYTLSLHMLSQITIHSHLPHAHSHALHMHLRRYLHSPSLSHTLLHTLQQTKEAYGHLHRLFPIAHSKFPVSSWKNIAHIYDTLVFVATS